MTPGQVCEKLEGVNPSVKRPTAIARMFDSVAPRYDIMNDVLSLGQDIGWRIATTRSLELMPGERVLDVAAGTGTSAAPLVKTGAEVLALDRSPGMVTEGRRRQPHVEFTVGDAMALPFKDGAFDAITISFGLRNLPDPPAALAEMARVTRPGGRLVVCEFSKPRWGWLRLAHSFWLRHVMPLAARLSTHPDSYNYLAETITAWPPATEIARWMDSAGWHDIKIRQLTGGIVALHRGTR